MIAMRWSHLFAIVLLCAFLEGISGQNDNEVYGVRWFLGDHFQFTRPDQISNEYYVLMFNTDQPLQGDLFLMVNSTRFSCSSSFLTTKSVEDHHSQVNQNASMPGDIEQTYIHKCIVTDIQQLPGMSEATTAEYQIQLEDLNIKENMDHNLVGGGYQITILFKGVFRIPMMQGSLDVIVIGDWGIITEVGESKGYVDSMPCLEMKIQDNFNISMVLFTGDLAYDFQGVHYRSMLKYIEVISSKMVFMVTPGNHDTVHHADTFQLFIASFYSPHWRQYYNYFYTLKLGNIVFIEFNPEVEVFTGLYPNRMNINQTHIFQTEFPPERLETLKKQYFTIAFSHYPIYCSDINDDHESCVKNLQRFQKFIEYFKKMGLSLYISGHVHVYERTKPICWNGSYIDANDNSYDFECPVYIVEGAAGNDFYVQLEDQYPLREFSQSLVYNTGFGILSLNVNRNSQKVTNVTYQHISSQSCDSNDNFLMYQPLSVQPQESGNHIFIMLLKIAIVVLGLIAIVCLALRISKRFDKGKQKEKSVQVNKNSKDDHIEMVEEQFETPNVNKQNVDDLQTQ